MTPADLKPRVDAGREPTRDTHHDTHDTHDKQDKHDDPLRGSRTSGAWAAVIGAAVLLVLLVIFIVQNTEKARIEFLWLDGRFPLAAALLLATVVGMIIAGLVGSLRILQLRRRVKRERR